MLPKLIQLWRKKIIESYRFIKQQPLEAIPDTPDLFRQYRGFLASGDLKRRPGGWEYLGKFYPDYLTVGGASHAIFRTASQFCHGKGVDVGAGLWPLPGSTPVDLLRGPGANSTLADIADNSLDYIFSSHCLEHIKQWHAELDCWISKLKHGGIVFIYLPHPECAIWHPGSPMVGNGHVWQPDVATVKQALLSRGCQMEAYDDGPDAMMSFFVCAQKQP